MSAATVDQQILDALALVLTPAATGALTVEVERDDSAEPYEPVELPAINIMAIEDEIAIPTQIGMGFGVDVVQMHRLALVVQIVYRGSGAGREARAIGLACEKLVAADPLLGGVCSMGMVPNGRQWVQDDRAEKPLMKQNTRFLASYRTYSNAPDVAV